MNSQESDLSIASIRHKYFSPQGNNRAVRTKSSFKKLAETSMSSFKKNPKKQVELKLYIRKDIPDYR